MTAKFIALYKTPDDIAAFEAHYFSVHVPLVEKIPGLVKANYTRLSGTPMGESPYYMMAELVFENKAAMDAGLGSPEGRASGKDAMVFAGNLVTMMMGEEAQAPVTGAPV